jgi:hypothetical protein
MEPEQSNKTNPCGWGSLLVWKFCYKYIIPSLLLAVRIMQLWIIWASSHLMEPAFSSSLTDTISDGFLYTSESLFIAVHRFRYSRQWVWTWDPSGI